MSELHPWLEGNLTVTWLILMIGFCWVTYIAMPHRSSDR